MNEADPLPCQVTKNGDRTVFMPSRLVVGMLVGGFGLGAVSFVGVASRLSSRGPGSLELKWAGGLFLLCGCQSAVLGLATGPVTASGRRTRRLHD